MFFKLFFVSILSLFTSIGAFDYPVDNLPSKLSPSKHNLNYVIDRENNNVIGGYYSLTQNDNPITQLFMYQVNTWNTFNVPSYSNGWIMFATILSEGSASYYWVHTCALNNFNSFRNAMDTFLNTYWTGTDFIIFDLIHYHYSSPSPTYYDWCRLYVVGEKMIGTEVYFEDNLYQSFTFSGTLWNWCIFGMPFVDDWLNNDSDTSVGSTYHKILSTESNIFYTKDYTTTTPYKLSFALINDSQISSVKYDSFMYGFIHRSFFQSGFYDYYPLTSNYQFKFGFNYPQNYGYNQGYDAGYDDGYNMGLSDGYPEAFEDGYDEAQSQFYDSRYNEGYQAGVSDGRQEVIDQGQTASIIFNGIISVGLLPTNVFLRILNFEVFGINIGALVSSLLTILVIIIIVRTFLGGSSSKE